MANFNVDGRMTVKGLKANFKKAFGCSLRVYTTASCKQFAKDDERLANIRSKDATGGSFSVGSNTKVGNFEKNFTEAFGIGVQVSTPDDSELADDNVTLSAAGK